jgi:hypothetical protein
MKLKSFPHSAKFRGGQSFSARSKCAAHASVVDHWTNCHRSLGTLRHMSPMGAFSSIKISEWIEDGSVKLSKCFVALLN